MEQFEIINYVEGSLGFIRQKPVSRFYENQLPANDTY